MHTFGWGRRTCLGNGIVDDEMFCFGAGVLWALDAAPRACPRTGGAVAVDTRATNSHVILEPSAFVLDFRPRSAERGADVLDGYKRLVGELKL